MAIKQRLIKLERGSPAKYREIIQLIRKGAYYDELTEEQQRQYKEYSESWGAAAKDIALAELSVLLDGNYAAFHFQLQPRRRPPTAEEHAATMAEIEEWFKECVEEYKSSSP